MKYMKLKTSIILSSLLFLSACNEHTNHLPTVKKIENTINNDLTAIKTLVDKTNNKLLAVYDIGINGFKLVITENQFGQVDKSVLSDNAEVLLGDAVLLSSNQSLAEKIEKIDFPETQNKSNVQKYLKDGFDKSVTLTVKKGNGERKLMVMTDPDCPFCKQLEKELKSVDNIEITYIFLPLESLHPDAKRKVELIWAAGKNNDERVAVWQHFQETGELPNVDLSNLKPEQKYNFDYINKVQQDLNAIATPFMMNMNNGEILMGTRPANLLEQYLDNKNYNVDNNDFTKLKESGFTKIYPN